MSPQSPEWKTALEVLQQWADDPSVLDHDPRARTLIAKIHREGSRHARLSGRAQRRSHDRELSENCGLVASQTPAKALMPSELAELPASSTGETRQLKNLASCYICLARYNQLHHFYHRLCPACAEFNYAKRQQRADLSGRRALVTGGRIKIGFELALKLLRDGAQVLVTTRFPADALERYARESDYAQWRDRLEVVGLDLRFLGEVEAFCNELTARWPHLDILVNNAAQTIKRPPQFYAHLRDAKANELEAAHNEALAHFFPAERFDIFGQPLDLRPQNSWSAKLGEVETLEAAENYLVNALSPFVLCGKLRPMVEKSPFEQRFMVCASAMEGQFARHSKTVFHPHTNMAKAALNMLVRTSGGDLKEAGIFLTAVDTGWITDENPFPKAAHLRDNGFIPPLDCQDGASRLYDPIARGINESSEPFWGCFLKDYAPYAW